MTTRLPAPYSLALAAATALALPGAAVAAGLASPTAAPAVDAGPPGHMDARGGDEDVADHVEDCLALHDDGLMYDDAGMHRHAGAPFDPDGDAAGHMAAMMGG